MTNFRDLATEIENWISKMVEIAGVHGVVLGLSGGIDSGVTAALATGALGPENILCLLLPCRSMPEDTEDALKLADLLGVEHRIIDLEPVLAAFEQTAGLDTDNRMLIANLKSRLRMAALYAHSEGRLVVGTCNWSEIQIGYWTKWGDGAADILPLARLYKNEVIDIARASGLPRWLAERVPSAGLWAGQSDEEEMRVTYEDIRRYFRSDRIRDTASERITEMITSSEHKRNPIPYFDARKWIENND